MKILEAIEKVIDELEKEIDNKLEAFALCKLKAKDRPSLPDMEMYQRLNNLKDQKDLLLKENYER